VPTLLADHESHDERHAQERPVETTNNGRPTGPISAQTAGVGLAESCSKSNHPELNAGPWLLIVATRASVAAMSASGATWRAVGHRVRRLVRELLKRTGSGWPATVIAVFAFCIVRPTTRPDLAFPGRLLDIARTRTDPLTPFSAPSCQRGPAVWFIIW
jgi:hypothetical protein